MSRNLETLVRRVREELRAEGPDGAGISDFAIEAALNAAQDDLSEEFPIRDTIDFSTVEGQNTYSLSVVAEGIQLVDIIRVTYDGTRITYIDLDEFFSVVEPEEGSVNRWTLWGTQIVLIGDVEEDKSVTLYVTRAPHRLEDIGDEPEMPFYTDEALIQYAVSAAYRESRDYDRANYHHYIYRNLKRSLLSRGVPQGQRARQSKTKDTYWGPVRGARGRQRTDTNPGGGN